MADAPARGKWSGDLGGGLAAAVVALPSCIAYGVIAFGPLGANGAEQGIIAGLVALIVGGAIAALIGGAPMMVTEPRAPLALIIAAVLTKLMSMDLTMEASVTFAFLVVAMGGMLQILFGLLRAGALVKFISYPVIAGFLNGTAFLIVGSQLWNLLGVAGKDADLAADFRPLALVVGLVTAGVMEFAPKLTKKVHGSIIALVVGTGLHYALVAGFGADNLGATVGAIPSEIPKPTVALDMVSALSGPAFMELVPFLVAASFSIAILGSIEALMTSVTMCSLANLRPSANRELLGQGLGNVVSSCFGGMAAAGAMGPSAANFQAGGRTRLSGLVCSALMLVIYLSLASVVGLLPKAALSGVLLIIAYHMLDKWSIRLFKRMLSPRELRHKELWQSGLVIVAVMVVTVTSGLVAAVTVGVGASIIMFVITMSRSIIRRQHDASRVRSKKQRNDKLMDLLEEHGHRIVILELEGAMFFGSADHLSNEIDRLAQGGAQYIILDMKRVKDLDITTARLIQQTNQRLASQGRVLALSYANEGGTLGLAMKEAGLFEAMGRDQFFSDTDMALEHFEERLLLDFSDGVDHDRELPLAEFRVLEGLSEEERETLADHLEALDFSDGDALFEEGDTDRALFLLARGHADVVIFLEGGERSKRLHTFAAGTVIGEMALLEGQPRSATVVAREASRCYKLSQESYEQLGRDHPRINLVLLTNLARILSERVRKANDMIRELEA
jgi:SulP family sulfate permease